MIFTLDPAAIVQLVLAVFLPLLVGLVTTKVTSSSKKAWLLAGLTLVTSLFTQLGASIAAHVAFDLGVALISVIPAFITSVGVYYGLWKPTGIGAAAQNVDATTIVK